MIKESDIKRMADNLFDAEKKRKQIGLISSNFPEMTLKDAYAIQEKLIENKLSSGLIKKGWKIGLTSKAMQRALNIETPDSGVLFDNMFFENGSTIPQNRFIQPRIEAEIAFIMKEKISGKKITKSDIIDATDYVCPALEILDTRIKRSDPTTGQTRKIFDTIADNAANAGIILGNQNQNIEDCDLRRVGCILKKNNEVEETGLGAGILDDPVTAVLWLIRRLADFNGYLDKGDVVLSGSFIRPVETSIGDQVIADFDDFGFVSCTF